MWLRHRPAGAPYAQRWLAQKFYTGIITGINPELDVEFELVD